MKSKGSRNTSNKRLTREQALKILRVNGCSDSVIEHVETVSRCAKGIAESIERNGHPIDVDFVEVASLLHDVGRCTTHGIGHGVAGARILKDYPAYARVCERHIGAGLTASEASKLGLPPKEYIPLTLEEKVIAHADNIVQGDRVVSIDESLERFRQRLGTDHPAISRIRRLNDEIESLL